MIRRPPRSTLDRSSAASDVYKRQEELSIEEYLAECKRNPLAYATAAERMLKAIGDPQMVDTRNDPRMSRLFANKVIKIYPAFAEFYGCLLYTSDAADERSSVDLGGR